MNYLIYDFMKPCRRDQTRTSRRPPRSGELPPDSGRQTIPWGEARRSAAECARHSPVELSRGERSAAFVGLSRATWVIPWGEAHITTS